MEAKAILLFMQFTQATQLYRCTDGEYFVELDDAAAYIANYLGAGGYSIVYRTTPLPALPTTADPTMPIWVYVPNPTIEGGLRYDGVISSTIDNLSVNIKEHVCNNVGAFKRGSYVTLTGRSGTTLGMSKYGRIVTVANNVLTINFLKFDGDIGAAGNDWDVSLTGMVGPVGPIGQMGNPGVGHTQILNCEGDPTMGNGQDMAYLDLILDTVSGNLWRREEAGGLAGMISYPGNIHFRKIADLKPAATEVRFTVESPAVIPLLQEEANKTILLTVAEYQITTINLDALALLSIIIVDNARDGNVDIVRGTATYTVLAGERAYIIVDDVNHITMRVQTPFTEPHVSVIGQLSHTMTVPTALRGKLKYVMSASGAKTFNLADVALGREIELINSSTSGVITVNLPTGHIWTGMLNGTTVTVDRGNSLDSFPNTIPIKATIFKTGATSWLAV
jgi:hypothetical protein